MNTKAFSPLKLKRLFFCIVLAFIIIFPSATEVYAQKINWEWVNTRASSQGSCTDHAGNIYVPSGVSVSKFSPQGKLSSIKFDALNIGVFPRSIAVDTKGNVYVVAEFSDFMLRFGKDSIKREGHIDVCILKYDSTGKSVWAKGITGYGIKRAMKIRVDNADNIVVVGSFSHSPIRLDSTVLNNNKIHDLEDDIFIAKFDPNGKVIWAQYAGGTKDEACFGLDVDDNDGIYITGYSKSDSAFFGGKILHNQTTYPGQSDADIFVAKYTGKGELSWVRSFNANHWLADDMGHGIIADSNGNVYVTGSYGYDGMMVDNIELKSEKYYNIFLIKLDTAGKAIWAKSAVADISRSITLHKNTISICGYSNKDYLRFDNNKIPIRFDSRDLSDMCFVARYDTSGNFIGTATAYAQSNGSTHRIYFNDIVSDLSGNSYIIGDFNGFPPFYFGTITLTQGHFPDGVGGFIARVGNSVISSINQTTEPEFSLYPNPSKGKIFITGLEGTGWSIEFYNLLGACSFTSPVSEITSTFDLSGFEKGAYILNLKKDNKIVKTSKIVLE